VLRLHQVSDLLDEIRLADVARVLGSPRLQYAPAIRK
jgi:hypothetical protein